MGRIMRRIAAVVLSAVLFTLPASSAAVPPSLVPSAVQVTVRFHANGGMGYVPQPIQAEQGTQITIPQDCLGSPMGIGGWYFAGWSQRSSAGSPDYLPGDVLSPVKDMDLFAVFSQDHPDTSAGRPITTQPSSLTLKSGAHTKYMNGSEDGLFYPNRAVTRAEMAQMLYNIVSDRPAAGAGFSDVPSDAWYAQAVESMAGLGILEGYADGSFRPGQAITRAESAQAMARLIPAGGEGRSFADIPSDHPNYAAISTAGGYGLFHGDDHGNFNPSASLLRSEAAVVFNKLLGRSPDPSAIYSTSLRYFPDVPSSHWAYGQIMEATVSHGHTATAAGGERWQDIQHEPVALSDGFHRIGGRLYYVKNGQFLRSATLDCFEFDAEGRYTTGDADLDVKLNALVEEKTSPSMSRDQKLKALYNYVRDNFTYLKRPLVAVGRTGWEPEYASSFLSMKKGNCFSFSALFCLLAREVGQPAYTVVGGLGKNASSHGWVEIRLDGTVYMFDPQLEWRYVYDYGRKSYDLFKFLPQNARNTYTKMSGGTP